MRLLLSLHILQRRRGRERERGVQLNAEPVFSWSVSFPILLSREYNTLCTIQRLVLEERERERLFCVRLYKQGEIFEWKCLLCVWGVGVAKAIWFIFFVWRLFDRYQKQIRRNFRVEEKKKIYRIRLNQRERKSRPIKFPFNYSGLRSSINFFKQKLKSNCKSTKILLVASLFLSTISYPLTHSSVSSTHTRTHHFHSINKS